MQCVEGGHLTSAVIFYCETFVLI